MKTCSACDVEKPLSEFSFIKAKGIYEARCKRCRYLMERRDHIVTRPWSALDDARLLTLDAIGVPLDVIAILIERSLSRADARLTLLREKLFKEAKRVQFYWTPDRIARLREMIDVKGYSRSEAAAALGVSRNSAIGAAQRHLPELCRKATSAYTKCRPGDVNAFVQRRA